MIVPRRPDASSPRPRGPAEFSPSGGNCRRAALTGGDKCPTCQRISSAMASGRLRATSPVALAAYAAAPSACAPIWGMAAACPAARAAAAAAGARETSRHERRHHRRIGGGSARRRSARHEQRPESERLHRGDGCPPALLPRTAPAPARRSPPPTPPRSAARPRSASAANPSRDLFTRPVLGPLFRAFRGRGR